MSEEQIPLRNEVLSFEIDKDGALVCKINGTIGDMEGCIETALKWFSNDEIRNRKAVKLWDKFCADFSDERITETFVSFNNPYKVHIMRSDFLANPGAKIERIAELFKVQGERRAYDIEEWYRRETEHDERTD